MVREVNARVLGRGLVVDSESTLEIQSGGCAYWWWWLRERKGRKLGVKVGESYEVCESGSHQCETS